MRGFILSVALFSIGYILSAQDLKQDSLSSSGGDSIQVKSGKKVITIESYAKRFNPRKALLYAAILPGSGQIYNRKYWKVPLVYGGFVGLISVVGYYQKLEVKYKSELFSLINDPTLTISASGLGLAQLRTVVDKARRQRDYFLAVTGLFYILQMVDAHVDAHLKEFDLNPNLHVKIEPVMDNNYLTGSTAGIAFKFRF